MTAWLVTALACFLVITAPQASLAVESPNTLPGMRLQKPRPFWVSSSRAVIDVEDRYRQCLPGVTSTGVDIASRYLTVMQEGKVIVEKKASAKLAPGKYLVRQFISGNPCTNTVSAPFAVTEGPHLLVEGESCTMISDDYRPPYPLEPDQQALLAQGGFVCELGSGINWFDTDNFYLVVARLLARGPILYPEDPEWVGTGSTILALGQTTVRNQLAFGPEASEWRSDILNLMPPSAVETGGKPSGGGTTSSPGESTSPIPTDQSAVPGRFCREADLGRTVKTASYGLLRCAMSGDRARWTRV